MEKGASRYKTKQRGRDSKKTGFFESCSACEIERRPRGASRAALAPTFVSGQLFLWDLCERLDAWLGIAPY
ncbi:hypothetical protein LD001_23305, partial [Pseudomonas kurunegalensis]|uniref:hypothetical protein n=1 Tax=Pseudomonas kurunegalensis TaxID=485880 RepID=UPI001CDC7757